MCFVAVAQLDLSGISGIFFQEVNNTATRAPAGDAQDVVGCASRAECDNATTAKWCCKVRCDHLFWMYVGSA